MDLDRDKFKPGDLVQLHERDWHAINLREGRPEDMVGMILSEEDPFLDPQETEPTYTVLWFNHQSHRRKYNYGFELQRLEQTKG